MSIRFDELPTWNFDVQEVSAGVYRATGIDEVGHRAAAEGLDPEACLEECRSAARRIDESRHVRQHLQSSAPKIDE